MFITDMTRMVKSKFIIVDLAMFPETVDIMSDFQHGMCKNDE